MKIIAQKQKDGCEEFANLTYKFMKEGYEKHFKQKSTDFEIEQLLVATRNYEEADLFLQNH